MPTRVLNDPDLNDLFDLEAKFIREHCTVGAVHSATIKVAESTASKELKRLVPSPINFTSGSFSFEAECLDRYTIKAKNADDKEYISMDQVRLMLLRENWLTEVDAFAMSIFTDE